MDKDTQRLLHRIEYLEHILVQKGSLAEIDLTGTSGGWHPPGAFRDQTGVWRRADSFQDQAGLWHPSGWFQDITGQWRPPGWFQG